MELILRQDVENLGFKDDIVDVKHGFGRNFLIPTGKASLATSSARNVLAENLKQRAYKEAKLIEDANIIAETVKGYEIKIASKTGSGDKLFGSVNNIDLAAALAKAGTNLDKKFIKVVGGSVKRLGKYEAAVRLHRAVVADITFEVVSE
jgi:large subunit ribosomal protein L9